MARSRKLCTCCTGRWSCISACTSFHLLPALPPLHTTAAPTSSSNSDAARAHPAQLCVEANLVLPFPACCDLCCGAVPLCFACVCFAAVVYLFVSKSHSDISLSFNGGKDSTVLLHLMRIALHPELDLSPLPPEQQPAQQQQKQHSQQEAAPQSSQQQQRQPGAWAEQQLQGAADPALEQGEGGRSSRGQSQLELVSVPIAVHQPTQLSSSSSQEWGQSHNTQHFVLPLCPPPVTVADACASPLLLWCWRLLCCRCCCPPGLDKLSSFYFEREDDFAEVRDFVKEQDRT